ncbi:MAG: flippase-like domain-containing protein [Bacteroidetes bacterium]|nr:flippase-like domain-containing protein [Bacteroidota bacterium]
MMKSKYIQVLQYISLLGIGFGLSWMFFRDLNFSELEQVVGTGNFFWFYVVMAVSVAVYVFRTLRWQMLIKAIGHETKFHNIFAALSISYFVSFVVPRLGEVSRCLSVKKQHNIPFMELLGTVIIERVVDVISLMIMLLLTLILQFDQIIEFMQVNVFKPIYEGIILKILAGNFWMLIAAITFLLLFIFLTFYFRKYIKERSPKLIMKFLEGLKQGLISIAKLKEKRLFFIYTVLIWLGYYFMTYFWFFVFKETSVLSWGACLAIVSIGTIGRSVPIQGGGMGAYHFLVNQVVLLYGVTGLFFKTLATLIHAGQTFFTFAMGLVGLIIFFVVYWKKK